MQSNSLLLLKSVRSLHLKLSLVSVNKDNSIASNGLRSKCCSISTVVSSILIRCLKFLHCALISDNLSWINSSDRCEETLDQIERILKDCWQKKTKLCLLVQIKIMFYEPCLVLWMNAFVSLKENQSFSSKFD